MTHIASTENTGELPPGTGADIWMRVAAITNLVGLGGFLVWATFAPLAEGVVATGQVIVDNEKQIVQHLEGGIISDLLIKEGDHVEKGQILIALETITSEARRDQAAQHRATSLASIRRLESLLAGQNSIQFDDIVWNVPKSLSDSITAQQSSLFHNQRRTHEQSISLLESRKISLVSGTADKKLEAASIQSSLDALSQELTLIEDLAKQKLARRDEVYQLSRQEASLKAELARLSAQSSQTQSQVLEIDQELRQLNAQFKEQQSTELVEAYNTLAASDEELKSLNDAVQRAVVIAPASGEILNLQFSTIGGVVRPGEPIMEIVPVSSGLWASLQINPSDRDAIYPGLAVRARLSAFKSWQSPSMDGEVRSISADLKTVPETGVSYYEAKIQFSATDLAGHDIAFTSPGMPVEAFVQSGVKRTFMDYALEPIIAHFSKGLSTG